ncbi:MAG: hypothetical protein U5L72_12420 [Bacteroidales bacterium]|nr:hypothetical protein [Bacteroidales bacterium]
MTDMNLDYGLYLKFIETYAADGYQSIDRTDPLIIELEHMSETNNQFFHVGDILRMKIFFTSMRSTRMIGIDPDELNPYQIIEATHPDSMERHYLARVKMFKIANELYMAEKGTACMSFNMKTRNGAGGYSELLFQLYFFYTTIPYKSVLIFKVYTLLDWLNNNKHDNYCYIGKDMSFFRYPDERMLLRGNQVSECEF